jgi:hypothetical protein
MNTPPPNYHLRPMKRQREAYIEPSRDTSHNGANDSHEILHALHELGRRFEKVETQCYDLHIQQRNHNTLASETLGELRQEFETLNKSMTTSRTTAPGPAPTASTTPIRNNPGSLERLLAEWYWVSEVQAELIVNGKFDIYKLPWLHRDENFRESFGQKLSDSSRLIVHDGQLRLDQLQIPLERSFEDINSFLPAWHIYIMLRGSSEPLRYPGFVFWTENIIKFGRAYPWPAVAQYVTQYFQSYQNAHPDNWFETDSNIFTDTILVPWAGRSHDHGARQNPEIEMCRHYNRERGCFFEEREGRPCRWRHACRDCNEEGHPVSQCPYD